METCLELSHVCKDLFTIFGHHTGIPCLIINLLGCTRALDQRLGVGKLFLDLVSDLWQENGGGTTGSVVPAGAVGVGGGISLLIVDLLIFFFVPVLLGL